MLIYSVGDSITWALPAAEFGSASVALCDPQTGKYLDFADKVLKSSGWTTKVKQLTPVGSRLTAELDTTNTPAGTLNVDLIEEWTVDGETADGDTLVIRTVSGVTAQEVRQELDANSTKLANLDATISSRATAAAVRSEMDSNSTKLANLDATVSSRSTNAGVRAEMDANSAKLANLDAPVSSRSTFNGGTVLGVTNPVTVGTVQDKTGYSLSAAYDGLASSAQVASLEALLGNLATSAQVLKLMTVIRDPMDVLNSLSKAVTGIKGVTFGTEDGWETTGTILAVPDYAVGGSGASALRLTIDVSQSSGASAILDLGADNVIDAAGASHLLLDILSEGAGQFLAVEVSADAMNWETVDVTIANEAVGILTRVEYPVTVSSIRYIRYRVTNLNIDQDKAEGVQLWPGWGKQSINVWVLGLSLKYARPALLTEMIAASGVLFDQSGLASKGDVYTILDQVKSAYDMVRVLRDWASDKVVVDPCESSAEWTSSDPAAVSALLDRQYEAFGGAAIRLGIDLTAGQGVTVTKMLPPGLGIDLTLCEALTISCLPLAYGDFLRIGIHLVDGWYDVTIPFIADDEHKWVSKTLAIPVIKRGVIDGIRFTVSGNAISDLADSQLWPDWKAGETSVWVDRIEAKKAVAVVSGSDWS